MAELTHEELKAEHEIVKSRLADVMAEGGSYRNLQVQLDAALQKHADYKAEIQAALDRLRMQHEQAMQAAMVDREAALKDQAAQMETRHAAEIARLKAEVLVPAQRDLHARQLADLQAKHAAELAKLQ